MCAKDYLTHNGALLSYEVPTVNALTTQPKIKTLIKVAELGCREHLS